MSTNSNMTDEPRRLRGWIDFLGALILMLVAANIAYWRGYQAGRSAAIEATLEVLPVAIASALDHATREIEKSRIREGVEQ